MRSAAGLAWWVRSRVPAQARGRVRTVVDVAARGPLASLQGVRTPAGSIGLTFDDGPDPVHTPLVLDELEAAGARATFFVLAYRVRQQPDLVREVVARGHDIALHGDVHERLTAVPRRDVQRRLSAARVLVEDVAQREVRWFRPPFGAQSVATQTAIQAAGLRSVVWGPTVEDWVEGTPHAVAARGLATVAAGDIMLCHDGLEVPPGAVMPQFDRGLAVRALLAGLQHKGLNATTIDTLLSTGHPRHTVWIRP